MKFKDLSFFGKLHHIWYYYRWHIIGTILGTIALASLVYTMFIKTPTQTYCGVAIYDQFLSMEDNMALSAELTSALSLPSDQAVTVQSFYTDSNDITVETDMNQKFNTYLYAGEIHIIISDEEYIKAFTAADYFAPADEFLPKDKFAAIDKNRLLYVKDPQSGKEKPFAIDISDSAVAKKYKLFTDKKAYLAFVPMEEIKDNLTATYDVIIKK